jgi:hypothetical protein
MLFRAFTWTVKFSEFAPKSGDFGLRKEKVFIIVSPYAPNHDSLSDSEGSLGQLQRFFAVAQNDTA